MKNNSLDIRIVADTQEDIFADLRIHKENNFLKIHDFLVENFHLDKLEMSSFFYSNDDWDKGEEITLMKPLKLQRMLPLLPLNQYFF